MGLKSWGVVNKGKDQVGSRLLLKSGKRGSFAKEMFYEKHVLFSLNQIYYRVLKCTTCYHYTNIIKSGLINLIKIGNIFTTEKGLA
jgi:hypothetical protein